jgi:hypothetical protein
MSFCSTACCLAHRGVLYFNLQDRTWVHTDGWRCDPEVRAAVRIRIHAVMDELAAQREAAP